jgi:hypothetical protein
MTATYVVQPGDTPMGIAQKLVGNPAKVNDLVRQNPHKPSMAVGQVLTFRELRAGEVLAVPTKWAPRGLGSCCASCEEHGTTCRGAPIPGQTAFPVGFGQTGTTAVDAVSAWAVPLTIGAISLAAGFGLAYVLTKGKS